MKKLRPQAQLRHRKAAKRELRKRRRRWLDAEIYGDRVRRQNAQVPDAREAFPTEMRRVAIAGDLELTKRPRDTVRTLLGIDLAWRQSWRALRLLIDLKEVRAFDAAALLLFAGRLRHATRNPRVQAVGNWPADTDVTGLMLDANFQGFIKGEPPVMAAPGVVQLEFGVKRGSELVDPRIGVRIRTFLRGRHPSIPIEELDTLCVAVLECLENIRLHAYRGREHHGWYVVGLHRKDRRLSSVAILDLGVGIRATVERRVRALRRAVTSNADFVLEAIRGRWKERQHRGKGFGYLREFVRSAAGRRLHVLSSGAMVTLYGNRVRKRRTDDFDGTLVCLEIAQSDEAFK